MLRAAKHPWSAEALLPLSRIPGESYDFWNPANKKLVELEKNMKRGYDLSNSNVSHCENVPQPNGRQWQEP